MNTRMVRLFQFNNGQGDAPKPKAKTASAATTKTAEAKSADGDPAKAAVAALIAEMAAETPKRSRGANGARYSDGSAGSATAEQTDSNGAVPRTPAVRTERRHRRRVKISAPVRVRQVNIAHGSDFDVTMTIDVSREGVLFESGRNTYTQGQEVAVVFPYRPVPGEQPHEQRGQVVRVARASEKRYGIAVAFIEGKPTYELVDSLGRPLESEAARLKTPGSQASGHPEKQMVLVVDADERQRRLLRSQLEMQGYAVEDVAEPNSAMSILRHRTPAAIVSESEAFPGTVRGGGEMSGYDFCVIVRRNVKFTRVPIVLTTRTGLPSDFSTAHALGATVCVAKPYDMERLVNLLRMLAPAHPANQTILRS